MCLNKMCSMCLKFIKKQNKTKQKYCVGYQFTDVSQALLSSFLKIPNQIKNA